MENSNEITDPAREPIEVVCDPPAIPVVVPDGNPPNTHSPWWELFAVLAIGVLPNFMGAISTIYHPIPVVPYWLDTLECVVIYGCSSFAVLYLMWRSELTWKQFGIVRPNGWDFVLGIALFVVSVALMRQLPASLYDANRAFSYSFPIPQGPVESLMSCIKYTFAGFSEELITRCYLIARLSILLRSKATAILVAAMLFASYHVYQDLLGVIFALLFGCLFGTAFVLYRRIWPLVLGHALYNIRLDFLAGQI